MTIKDGNVREEKRFCCFQCVCDLYSSVKDQLIIEMHKIYLVYKWCETGLQRRFFEDFGGVLC